MRDSETTSLIAERMPLAKIQLFIAFLVQLTEPIAATVIYPFITQFVEATGITKGDEKATGYYAGIIQSVFFLAECVTVLLWGRASDRWGRKPILLLGPLGLFFAMLGFGYSSTFWPLVFFRFAQGAFNGNLGVCKIVLSELSDSTTRAEVFGLLPLIWSLGATIGPIIGGLFSNPDTEWPASFGKIPLLRQYPYLLPCLLAGSLSFIVFLIAAVGLKETHPLYRDRSLDGVKCESACETNEERVRSYGSVNQTRENSPAAAKTEEVMETPSIRSLMIPQVLIPVGCFAILYFTETAYIALLPLMYNTSIQNGGLGFSAYQIGSIMGVWGIFNIFWQALAVTPLIRRFGPRKIHIFGYSCHLIGLALFIVMNGLARLAGGVTGLIWCLIVIQFVCCNSMIYMSFATGHMFIVEGAPSPAALAVTNGLGQVAGTLARTIAPIVATSLFSFSTEHQIMKGYFVFVVLLCFTLAGIRVSLLLPNELRREKQISDSD